MAPCESPVSFLSGQLSEKCSQTSREQEEKERKEGRDTGLILPCLLYFRASARFDVDWVMRSLGAPFAFLPFLVGARRSAIAPRLRDADADRDVRYIPRYIASTATFFSRIALRYAIGPLSQSHARNSKSLVIFVKYCCARSRTRVQEQGIRNALL